jgi:hypothetical protein
MASTATEPAWAAGKARLNSANRTITKVTPTSTNTNSKGRILRFIRNSFRIPGMMKTAIP